MSEILPNNDSAEIEVITEAPEAEPSFLQKNKLIVLIVSAVLVVALGVGGFLLTRPSPAQPYLDRVCQAFNGLNINKTSSNQAKALIDAQESNVDLANRLDFSASIEVDKAFEDFKTYTEKFSSTNLRFAIAVTLGQVDRLKDIGKQMDIDTAYGESAIELMDTACGR
jgi:hypothetical protein